MPVVKRLMERLQELKDKGLTGLNLIATWVKMKIEPLQARTKLICEYAGTSDLQHHNPTLFETEEQFMLRMKRIIVHPTPEWEVSGPYGPLHQAPGSQGESFFTMSRTPFSLLSFLYRFLFADLGFGSSTR